ncbi:gamma-glutamyl kinase [Jannaschia pagri]|uniref:Gamma-glutamyl kinase n=1 Tax=Jannaschia pagri TaxID=2829797 RepID=A0ABQ4NPS8_9RHOB|nr:MULTISPECIES: gamma-glutamyl kinase [unclassified Jannaschia]GIT92253.1 gamma-glutamyl kinase [Jannaschia sp. AI_61]GIT96087.1 gamma-glutamyl kinase [Jannaschia sp. AI_62]
MLIFWKHRFVLLAVPKTGTTALEDALAPLSDAAIVNPPGLKHCGVAKYRRELAPFFEQKGRRPLELVAVMREPVDWLGSWFRYRSRPQLDGQQNSTKGLTFDEFVEAYLQDPQPDFAKVGSQARFLQGGVTHLFRHDRPADLTAFLSDRLGPLPDIPRMNVSPPGDLGLSARLHARLREENAEDFALWDSLQNADDAP